MKICSRHRKGLCEQKNPQPFSGFNVSKIPGNKGYFPQCKDCQNKFHKRKREKNKDYYRNAELKHRYGITLEQKKKILLDQGAICKICLVPLPDVYLSCVDHKHGTKQIRGVLCSKCNGALGMMRDNPELLIRAANYLMEAEIT